VYFKVITLSGVAGGR